MEDWLRERVQVSPQALGLVIGVRRWTYAALDGLTNDCGRQLLAAGLEPGQRLGVLLPNCLTYVCLIHACARLGVVLVPLNSRLTPAELSWQVAAAGCDLLVYAAEFSQTATAVAGPQLLLQDEDLTPAARPDVPAPFALEKIQAIVFTSGTSGRPKGVPLSFNNHFYSALGSAYRLGVQVDDLWLSCLPLYHVGGLAVIFRSCLYGTAVDLHPRFQLEAVNDSLDRKPITLISLVPTMLYRLLEVRTTWPDSLRLLLLGGAAATADLVEKARAARLPLATTYGLTEAASQVATMLPDAVCDKPGSVGKPLLFTTVKIVADDGHACAPNEYGELIVSGPTVMGGYLQEGGGPAAAKTPTAYATGDIGYFDEAGDLWLVQRRSDLIVSGGENVYPAEVEGVLKRQTAVKQVCVTGVPDAEWGQVVAALVVLEPGSPVSTADLEAHCRASLAGYKIPRFFQFAGTLPQTASGKIARQVVAQALADAYRHA